MDATAFGASNSPRMRHNFAWSLVGNSVYNAVQWVLVIFLARLGNSEMVGQFALAQAISAPIFLTVGLNLRVVRATDVRSVWSASQYARLRMILNAGSILVCLVIGVAARLDAHMLAVLTMISLSKASEARSQVLYGLLQRYERLDLVSRSLLIRAALGSAGFLTALVTTDDLVAACAGLAAGWFLTYLIHDRLVARRLAVVYPDPTDMRRTSTMYQLAKKAFPLGLDAGVASFANNVPRYAVQSFLGTAQLGAFAALAYLGRVVNMVTGSLAESMIGRLAKYASDGDTRGFRRLLGVLVMFGLAISAVGVSGAWLVGDQLIRLLLGAEYVNRPVLVLLMAGAGFITLQRALGRGLQAGHKFYGVLAVNCATLVGTIIAAVVLIPAFDLPGAAATLGAGFMWGSVLSALMLKKLVQELSLSEGEQS